MTTKRFIKKWTEPKVIKLFLAGNKNMQPQNDDGENRSCVAEQSTREKNAPWLQKSLQIATLKGIFLFAEHQEKEAELFSLTDFSRQKLGGRCQLVSRALQHENDISAKVALMRRRRKVSPPPPTFQTNFRKPSSTSL